jgi:hypothetical protein
MPTTPKGAPASVTFRTTLAQVPGKNPTGIVVPGGLIDELGHGKRPPVRVLLDGYEYRTTVGVMNGRQMVSVSSAVRQATGLVGGAEVDVTLTVDESPREAVVPDDLAAALDAASGTRAFFDGLSNSLRRFHIDNVNGAKAAETRQRRIDKAVELFRAGRPR